MPLGDSQIQFSGRKNDEVTGGFSLSSIGSADGKLDKNSHEQELSARVSREIGLAGAIVDGASRRTKELSQHPGQLVSELAGSAAFGFGLAIAQGRAGLIREAAQVVGGAMAVSFAIDGSAKANQLAGAVDRAWDGRSGGANSDTGDKIGAFLVDTAVMSAGGLGGVKVGRSPHVYMGVREGIDHLAGSDFRPQHASLREQMLAYHPLTGHHQDRVGDLSLMIARNMGLPPARVEMSYHAGRMHDIGKMKTPLEILDFPGKLEGHELDVMQHHATETGTILSSQVRYPGRLKDLPEVAQNHHEWLTGQGTPRGLKGDRIAVETRVNTVADVFDVLAHSRSYKNPTPVTEMLGFLEKGRGTQFDGLVLDSLYAQPANKVLPYMFAKTDGPVVANPSWLYKFKGVSLGELLESVKGGKPLNGSRVNFGQIAAFNELYPY